MISFIGKYGSLKNLFQVLIDSSDYRTSYLNAITSYPSSGTTALYVKWWIVLQRYAHQRLNGVYLRLWTSSTWHGWSRPQQQQLNPMCTTTRMGSKNGFPIFQIELLFASINSQFIIITLSENIPWRETLSFCIAFRLMWGIYYREGSVHLLHLHTYPQSYISKEMCTCKSFPMNYHAMDKRKAV